MATLKAEQERKAEAEVRRLQALVKTRLTSSLQMVVVVVQVVDADGNVVDVDGTKAVKNADGSIAIGVNSGCLNNNDGTASR